MDFDIRFVGNRFQESVPQEHYVNLLRAVSSHNNESNIPGREKLNNNPYSSSPYKASTIQRILASITYKYRLNGFQFDRKNPNIAETISAIVRDEKNNKTGS